MDEPTNHLDVETVEALGRALNSFKVSTLFNLTILLAFVLQISYLIFVSLIFINSPYICTLTPKFIAHHHLYYHFTGRCVDRFS